MKKIIAAFLLTLPISLMGQQNIERCLSHKLIEYGEQLSPGYQQLVQQSFDHAKNHSNSSRSNHTFTIPVVVHVVYNTPEQNLEDSIILEQIASLNEDYQRLNEDTAFMRSQFDPVKGNPNIKFKLAQIDPDGNPTSGITRTNTSTQTFGSFAVALGSFDDLEKVKSSADGGHNPWNTSRYLNIWVCNMEVFNIPALLGYASPPTGLPNWPAGQLPAIEDGVVIQYQAFGRNNPNELDMGDGPITVRGRTLTHEVGHYLGLRHIWGDGDCTEQDGIDDTPNADAQSDFDCNDTKNSCTDNISNVGDLDDMIENYMDYSAETCQNSFTQGQVDLMRGVLENQRYDLVHDNPASIEEMTASLKFQLYPNPTQGQLNLKLDDVMNANISIHDVRGNMILQKNITGNDHELDVNGFQKGVYFLNIQTDNYKRTVRWVKL